MSDAANNVPSGICDLSKDDWTKVFSSLSQEESAKLKDLIDTQLKAKTKSNPKKRSLKDLEDDKDGDEDIDLKKDSNEPSKKKAKIADSTEEGSMDTFCAKLNEDAVKDGIKKFVVGGLILNDSNQMLVLQRAKNEFMPNIYEIPSGTKDPEDKTLIDCLSREVAEESGLKLKTVLKFISTFDYKSSSGKPTRQFNFCISVESSENVKISEEHQAFGWVDESQLFDKESDDNKYNEVVSKITPVVRDVMRKGFKLFK